MSEVRILASSFFLSLFFAFCAAGALADSSNANRAGSVARGLDEAVSDMEMAQKQTLALKAEITRLQQEATTHESDLEQQSKQLADYHVAVTELEAQAQSDLDLAQDLHKALERERQWNQLLWPVAGTAVVVAIVEGIVLLSERR